MKKGGLRPVLWIFDGKIEISRCIESFSLALYVLASFPLRSDEGQLELSVLIEGFLCWVSITL